MTREHKGDYDAAGASLRVQPTETSYEEGCEVPSPCSDHLIEVEKGGKREKDRKYGGCCERGIIVIVLFGCHYIIKKSGRVKYLMGNTSRIKHKMRIFYYFKAHMKSLYISKRYTVPD